MLVRGLVAILAVLTLAPAASRAQAPPLTRIAFGSCADEEKPQPIWKAILAFQPELFLFTGDNVYGDVRDGKNVPEADLIDSLVHAYGQAAKVQDLMVLRATVPHLATWDDHDYGKNDAGERPAVWHLRQYGHWHSERTEAGGKEETGDDGRHGGPSCADAPRDNQGWLQLRVWLRRRLQSIAFMVCAAAMRRLH